MRCSIGSANAAVLPVPVSACTTRSTAFEHRGDGFPLHRRGLFVAKRRDGGNQAVGESKGSKPGGGGLCGVGRAIRHPTIVSRAASLVHVAISWLTLRERRAFVEPAITAARGAELRTIRPVPDEPGSYVPEAIVVIAVASIVSSSCWS